MTDDPAPACGVHDGHCITCSDEGIAMRVLGGTGEPGVVRCAVDGATSAPGQSVDVGLIEPVEPGDVVLVHAGVALLRLSSGAEVTP